MKIIDHFKRLFMWEPNVYVSCLRHKAGMPSTPQRFTQIGVSCDFVTAIMRSDFTEWHVSQRQKLDIIDVQWMSVPLMLSYKIALFCFRPEGAVVWVLKKGQAEVTNKPPRKPEPVCCIRLKFTSDCLLSQSWFYQRLASVGKHLYASVLERGWVCRRLKLLFLRGLCHPPLQTVLHYLSCRVWCELVLAGTRSYEKHALSQPLLPMRGAIVKCTACPVARPGLVGVVPV